MESLYDLSEEYAAALRELEACDLPDDAIADTLEGLSGTFEKKAVHVAFYVRNLEAEADMVKGEIDRLNTRLKTAKNRAQRYRDYLLASMIKTGTTKINDPLLSLRVNAPRDRVVIDDPDQVPDDFAEIRIDRVINKAELLKALKDETLPGAHLEKGEPSLTIS